MGWAHRLVQLDVVNWRVARVCDMSRLLPPPKKKFGGLSDSVVVDQSVDYSLFEFLTETC